MTHICVGKLTIIDSDNGLSPERRQAIIWTNAGILLIGPQGTNSSQIVIEIQTFSFCEMASILSRPQWVKKNSTWCVDIIVMIFKSDSKSFDFIDTIYSPEFRGGVNKIEAVWTNRPKSAVPGRNGSYHVIIHFGVLLLGCFGTGKGVWPTKVSRNCCTRCAQHSD